MATSFYQTKNNAKSTITNNPLAAGGLSITLASSTGSLFPTTGNTWLATIWSTNADPSVATDTEIVKIDSRSTDTLTVNASGRGFAGTTAVSHPTGSYIQLLVMKEHVDQITTAVNTLENNLLTFGSTQAINWTDYTPTITASAGTFNTPNANNYARYTQIGKMVTVCVYYQATATAGHDYINVTLPVTPAKNTDYSLGGGAVIFYTGTRVAAQYFYLASGPYIRIYANNDALAIINMVGGANSGVIFQTTYEVA